jgi:hypothetical protein
MTKKTISLEVKVRLVCARLFVRLFVRLCVSFCVASSCGCLCVCFMFFLLVGMHSRRCMLRVCFQLLVCMHSSCRVSVLLCMCFDCFDAVYVF